MKVVSNKCDVLAFHTKAKLSTKAALLRLDSGVVGCCKCSSLLLVIVVGQPSAQRADVEPLLPDA